MLFRAQVFEGQEESRALLDNLCQLNSSVVITSTRRVMSLHLRMQSLREEAVEASYQLKAVPCGGLYEASEGSLVSPRDLANVDGEEPPPVVVGIDNEVRIKLHVAKRDPHTSFRLRFRSGKPEIQPFSFSKSLSLGEKTTVTCGATTGKGPLSFHWSHNGADFGNSASRYVKVVTETIAALTIERVAAEHLGNYTCTVSNDIGSDSFSANLVVEGPPEVQPFFFSKNIALGQKALVNCGTVSGDGPFKFSWVQDGAKVLATSSKYVSTVADKFATLTIESVGAEDIGNYTCTVSNDVGSDSFTAPLVVKALEKPIIMPYSFPKNVLLGQKTVVTCVAQSGTGPLEFVWKHNGRMMVDKSSRYVKMLTESISTMTIERLATEDLGNYSCTVSNGAGSDSFTAPLVVEDKPQIQPFSFPPNVNLGEKASVTCSATRGDGPFRFTWTQDGRPIVNTASKYARTVVDDIATMTIEKVSAEDVGNYTCTVSNGAGRDSASASLMVEGETLYGPFQ
ncbi:hypothetical protein HPB47_013323 [Ixodes persulcatus]|uniref:Uncharacterized protein n=1 Tax=Ixodes persulcatus TaxID=34615 RepID=A0AC60QZM9_IXOPE|nr:hypothetical protein HPB47_013323 [Ixodes persulcatus]